MSMLILAVFVVGYAMIALEHPIKIDKAASAVLTGVFTWVILLFGLNSMPAFLGGPPPEDSFLFIEHSLLEHLSGIASILFFLLGAMTIVELVDVHDGFRVITDRITTVNQVRLLWILSIVTFFLSSVLDNMTTAIVMCALVRRIIDDQEQKWLMAGFIIIAANAGGAWSPIGDITTIMLWIGGQVTTLNIMKATFIPSLVSMLAPLAVASFMLKGEIKRPAKIEDQGHGAHGITEFQKRLILALGVGGLLFVPVFKTVTHMPPFMGILLAVGVLWVVTELMHKQNGAEDRSGLTVNAVLKRIDSSAILFFLGILLAVGALESSGHLRQMAVGLDQVFGNIYIINTLIGMLSAIVDNVPLVAAMMGMYPMDVYPPDHEFWNLLAYCAGTGGSILIIGSAAGVASMGILQINFLWYVKRVSFYALIGYLAGIAMFALGL